METKFKRVQEEINELEDINKRGNLTEKGKELLNEYKTLMDYAHSSTQLPTKEDIYVSQSNDGSDDVYCAFTDHTRGLKDCEEAGTLLTRITLYRN